MDNEVKAKWVAALRSGEYAQARGEMKDCNGARCCLGVLEEVVLGMELNPRQAILSHAAKEKAGMSSRKGIFKGDRPRALCSLNDYDKMSFVEIADIIETHGDQL